MRNYVQDGGVLTLTAASALSSGDPQLTGNIFGVALTDIANGDVGPFAVEGVVDLTKHAGDTPAQGALCYWDDTNKEVTTTSSGNTLIGVATKAALAGDATVRVRLNESWPQ